MDSNEAASGRLAPTQPEDQADADEANGLSSETPAKRAKQSSDSAEAGRAAAQAVGQAVTFVDIVGCETVVADPCSDQEPRVLLGSGVRGTAHPPESPVLFCGRSGSLLAVEGSGI